MRNFGSPALLSRVRLEQLRQTLNFQRIEILLLRHRLTAESITRPEILSTDVHDRPLIRILFRLTQHFVRHRRSIAFTKRDVLQQVRNRIPFTPAKVNVRQLSCFVAKKQ